MCPELKATNGDMWDRKKGEKTKEAHDTIMTTFYLILIYLFIYYFWGNICQFVPTQHSIYTLL